MPRPPPLTYEQLLRLLEQFPFDEGDVFRMDDMELPNNDYTYIGHTDPPDAVVLSLDKSKYSNVHVAKKRAAELFLLRGLRPCPSRKPFQTARYWCWYCSRVTP